MSLVSVIITNYNGKKYLAKCLSSLLAGAYRDFEIILVDNGSSDGSVSFVQGEFPDVKIIEMEYNAGLSLASNKGASQARGEYFFFLNNDTISDNQLLSELVSACESDAGVGVCGCRTMSYDGMVQLNAGVACDVFGYPYGLGLPLYVDAGIFIRRAVFELVGGFDPEIFLYGEDKDLCWRVLLYGFKVIVVPRAIFYHDSFCAIDAQGNLLTNIRRRFMSEAFTIRTLIKNYSLVMLLMVLPLYFLINLMEMLFFLFTGRHDVVSGVYIKAYQWNARNLFDTLRLRRIVQSQRRVSDAGILKRMYLGSGKLKLFKDIGIPKIVS